jgi:predicted HTH transcriptional regulator
MTAKRMKGETHFLEWKESWRDEYLKWLCGFANADGGTLIIGMNDKGEPVGAPDAARLLVDLQSTSQPHNPDIANTYFRTGLIEAWGRRHERIAEACREQGTPEATVESDGNGVRVKWAWVNPTSDADRIRLRDKRPGQVTPPVTPPVTDPVHRLLRALDAGSLTSSHLQAVLSLKHRPTFEWRAA